ncbi:MAG: Glycosyl transferase family 2 [Candidatus Falkowbacteria bacterium GW2011_GWC2_38_22]|uniref:Glycosyl transferase family 2 n=1 Tax=Candidatus Falkowbacteria bacterium GW2011_GWE1_38_31 TaxID=1618638 RepID=A0A0G0K6A6_9BACT|nr:MAG: Glycosyl transferase family 2 [Candidatus Falkowbacteria bacterium GW2011_GWF2_38_1205]KKQ62165.1 MAG: Glycosyl transferase family 2 [Candidatus Falkowbacteria bacterium GW2011_GWC2_38_22]KKQ64315.1 MAG: Glycosyl transferase family 2 [Candidatus Falkowbacteria bacterium GW2011_GWF1_38_22]KKQ66292.1 MAG: Glycosyl transferase family 2 [Candidatus Falkowbacteria bacterium GW2011_GWE2_38_254]KKQ71020.1 MAG: Glycosyl transferase family 2 [Candidatus Falkowbacteria bacterium GW2011_GWE1_38_31
MFKKVAIIISPNYKDYAEKFLPDCIKSIREQDYSGDIKIFITDNETSPTSVLLLKKLAPDAELVLNIHNDGFAKGCNDSMRLALSQGFDYIFLVSIHSILEKNCVSELVKLLESDKKIGVAQARMMLYGDTDIVASLGNETHFLGFGFSSGYKKRWENQNIISKDVFYTSGASMMFPREALIKVGLFDEEYWMYNEDQELPWRLCLNGWRAVVALNAVAVTKYNFKRSIKQTYWMDRNRIISIIICYKIKTLILILPAFIIMEIGQLFFAWKNKWLKDKLRVYLYFLNPKTWAYLISARHRNQSLRIIKDKEICKMITGVIDHQEFNDWKLRLINPFFNFYWKTIKFIMFW